MKFQNRFKFVIYFEFYYNVTTLIILVENNIILISSSSEHRYLIYAKYINYFICKILLKLFTKLREVNFFYDSNVFLRL